MLDHTGHRTRYHLMDIHLPSNIPKIFNILELFSLSNSFRKLDRVCTFCFEFKKQHVLDNIRACHTSSYQHKSYKPD